MTNSEVYKPISFSERCTATLAAAYNADVNDDDIVTTVPGGKCITSLKDTSYAAAFASGIFALVLEANPNLTPRDIMHLTTMTAEVAPLADNQNTWYQNGRGFWVSTDFGFGLMNAENMVLMAKNWVPVPYVTVCQEEGITESVQLVTGKKTFLKYNMKACDGIFAVRFLENISVVLTIAAPSRGSVQFDLISPQGTRVTILEPTPEDTSSSGYIGWPIKSLHFWGEDPRGTWQMEVTAWASNVYESVPQTNRYGASYPLQTLVSESAVREVRFNLYGTTEMPEHYKNFNREYAGFRLPDGTTSDSKK